MSSLRAFNRYFDDSYTFYQIIEFLSFYGTNIRSTFEVFKTVKTTNSVANGTT